MTNCDIDTSRVKGLHHHKNSWLHVSAGLGTNPMTPVRLACPPRQRCSRWSDANKSTTAATRRYQRQVDSRRLP